MMYSPLLLDSVVKLAKYQIDINVIYTISGANTNQNNYSVSVLIFRLTLIAYYAERVHANFK